MVLLAWLLFQAINFLWQTPDFLRAKVRIDGTPRLPEALHERFPVYSDSLVAWGYGRQRSIPRHPRKNLLVYTQGRLMAESPRFYLFFKDPRIFEFDRTKICTPIFCVSVLDYSGLLSTQIILRFYSKVWPLFWFFPFSFTNAQNCLIASSRSRKRK